MGSRGPTTDYYTVTHEEALAAGADNSEIGAMFFDHVGRLIHKPAQYFEAYGDQFEPYRNGVRQPDGSRRPLRFLEIGVSHGGSLQLWRKYFGPDAAVWGIDVNPACVAVDDPGLEVRIGSQDDRLFLERTVSEMGGVDIVLDDGSHIAKHQRKSFDVLFPLVSEGGIYAVEDLSTSYWPEHGGGYRRRGTFIEATKDIIDDMHSWYHIRPIKVLPAAESWVSHVSVYNGIVFFHKAPMQRPMVLKVGHESF
jgi:hypothetical protein